MNTLKNLNDDVVMDRYYCILGKKKHMLKQKKTELHGLEQLKSVVTFLFYFSSLLIKKDEKLLNI